MYDAGVADVVRMFGLEKAAGVALTFQGVRAPHAAVQAALAKSPENFTDWLNDNELKDDKGSPLNWSSPASIPLRAINNPDYDGHKHVAGDMWGMDGYKIPKPLSRAQALKIVKELEQADPSVKPHTTAMRQHVQDLYKHPDTKSVYLTYT